MWTLAVFAVGGSQTAPLCALFTPCVNLFISLFTLSLRLIGCEVEEVADICFIQINKLSGVCLKKDTLIATHTIELKHVLMAN